MASSNLLELSEYSIIDSKASVQNISDVQASLQRIAAEEQKLQKIKEQLLTQKCDLQNKVAREIGKKKKTTAFLKSEILDLKSEIQQLEKAIGLAIYDKTQVILKTPTVAKIKLPQSPPGCIGLLRCSKPEECVSYSLCLNKYMTAEMRNESIRL
jgi:hypothetical protein